MIQVGTSQVKAVDDSSVGDAFSVDLLQGRQFLELQVSSFNRLKGLLLSATFLLYI
jgi:hypothetical protein